MTHTYVKNISDLEFSRIIVREPKGAKNLLPGEIGLLLPSLVGSKMITAWQEKERLVVVTEAEYQAYLDLKNNPVEVIPVAQSKPLPRKTAAAKLPDGTSSVIAGLDEIPEADEIPEPLVSNIGKDDRGIAISAPADSAPLTSEAGDAVVPTKASLRPRVLNTDGSLKEDNLGETDLQLKVVKPAASSVAPSEAVVTPEATPPLTAATTITSEAVLSMKNWRQQKKVLDVCTDVKVLNEVKVQSKTQAIVEVCTARLASLK